MSSGDEVMNFEKAMHFRKSVLPQRLYDTTSKKWRQAGLGETHALDQDGKQLVCEVFYLLGTILIFLDLRIPGLTREQLIVGHYRTHGESQVTNFDEVCKLMRATGHMNGDRKATPKTYPQDYFSRLKLDHDL